MIINSREKTAVLKTLLLAMFILPAPGLALLGCGKKGPPEPPNRNRPPAVRDLGYNISNTTIKLSWTIPKIVETGLSPIIGFRIYRAKLTIFEADCPNCPIRYIEVGDVLIRGAGAQGVMSRTIVFTQEIEKGYYYYYKVLGYNDIGAYSRDSNVVEFSF